MADAPTTTVGARIDWLPPDDARLQRVWRAAPPADWDALLRYLRSDASKTVRPGKVARRLLRELSPRSTQRGRHLSPPQRAALLARAERLQRGEDVREGYIAGGAAAGARAAGDEIAAQLRRDAARLQALLQTVQAQLEAVERQRDEWAERAVALEHNASNLRAALEQCLTEVAAYVAATAAAAAPPRVPDPDEITGDVPPFPPPAPPAPGAGGALAEARAIVARQPDRAERAARTEGASLAARLRDGRTALRPPPPADETPAAAARAGETLANTLAAALAGRRRAVAPGTNGTNGADGADESSCDDSDIDRRLASAVACHYCGNAVDRACVCGELRYCSALCADADAVHHVGECAAHRGYSVRPGTVLRIRVRPKTAAYAGHSGGSSLAYAVLGARHGDAVLVKPAGCVTLEVAEPLDEHPLIVGTDPVGGRHVGRPALTLPGQQLELCVEPGERRWVVCDEHPHMGFAIVGAQ